MFKKVFCAVFTACGMLLGFGVIRFIYDRYPDQFAGASEIGMWILSGFVILLFGIIFLSLYFRLIDREVFGSDQDARRLAELVSLVPVEELVPGIIGLFVGILVSGIFANIIMGIGLLDAKYINVIICILIYLILGYYGWVFGRRIGFIYKDKTLTFFQSDIFKKKHKSRSVAQAKIFDTSVIIDGRIQEILRTGFIEGDIIIPDFVMVELRHISDAADELKRNRGRRGLDILNAIQEEYGIAIYDTSSNRDIAKIPEVDLKLLKLAEILGGVVVTNDYNLNKVAQVQGIGILNINELANTLKPAVLPGETMMVSPVKEGKTDDQSVAYLPDGTMIVVQGGRKFIGKTISVVVTSVLQTAAGRMIFVKPEKR